jgi:hypothetical protein
MIVHTRQGNTGRDRDMPLATGLRNFSNFEILGTEFPISRGRGWLKSKRVAIHTNNVPAEPDSGQRQGRRAKRRMVG